MIAPTKKGLSPKTLDAFIEALRLIHERYDRKPKRAAHAVPPAASEPTEGASNAPSPCTPAGPSPERAP